MGDDVLALLAGIWLADGLSLLIAPRWIMNRIREVISQSPGIFRWETLAIAAGLALLILGMDLAYQPLWMITACGMIGKGLFLWLSPTRLRTRVLEWCFAREEVDYRFWGLGLCALAVLLLHALGWIGHA
jgi:hypothetical protein